MATSAAPRAGWVRAHSRDRWSGAAQLMRSWSSGRRPVEPPRTIEGDHAPRRVPRDCKLFAVRKWRQTWLRRDKRGRGKPETPVMVAGEDGVAETRCRSATPADSRCPVALRRLQASLPCVVHEVSSSKSRAGFQVDRRSGIKCSIVAIPESARARLIDHCPEQARCHLPRRECSHGKFAGHLLEEGATGRVLDRADNSWNLQSGRNINASRSRVE